MVASTAGSDFVTPGRSKGLLSIPAHRYLLWRLIRKEVLIRYRGSILGWIWSFAKPAAQFAVYFLAVGIFMRFNGAIEAYPVYLFSGMILLTFFNETFGNATRSLVDNADLIKKIYLPRELFPVSTVAVALVNFLPQAIILLIVCLFLGWHPTLLSIAAIVVAILIVAVLALGLGLLFGAINVSFRDSQNVVELILMVAIWASPVLYQASTMYDQLPGWLAVAYQLNPITPAVELMHYGFWEPVLHAAPPASQGFSWFTLAAVGISMLVLVIGQFVFRRLEARFAQDL